MSYKVKQNKPLLEPNFNHRFKVSNLLIKKADNNKKKIGKLLHKKYNKERNGKYRQLNWITLNFQWFKEEAWYYILNKNQKWLKSQI